MQYLSTLVAALIGLAVGGVANVLADDLPHRRPPRSPRCQHCEQPRPRKAWLGSVALILGSRRCVVCGEALSLRHPIVELVLTGAFVYLWRRYGLSVQGLFIAAYVGLAVLISVIDIEHRLILNVVMGPALLLALADAALTPRLPFWNALKGGLIGFGVVLGIFLLGEGFRRLMARLRGQAINTVPFGFGDVTLATFAGLVVGGTAGRIGLVLLIMVFVGGVGAFAFLIYRLLIRRSYNLYTAIPYGPNIIIGMLIVLIWPDEMREILYGVQWALYGG